MEGNSRSYKALKNVTFGLAFQIFSLMANFIVRTIFVKKLGVEILGVNGLFSNILSVLSLADLGINTAMMYVLYKPIYEKDNKKISALLNYYKKIYRGIALIISLLGITVTPFLKYIVNSNLQMNEIILYYLLFLTNSVCSYLAVYRTCILTASQQEYKLKHIDIILLILKSIVQIIILVVYENYVLYLLSQILITVLNNVLKSSLSKKEFSIDTNQTITIIEKKSIWKNVKSLFLYQIGNVAMNNTDNILISIIVGTSIVGYYSNYLVIITALNSLIAMIFSSIQASLGNFNIEKSSKEKFYIYKIILFISDYIFSFCSIAMICLFNTLICIWLGEQFSFSLDTVIIIGLNFYVSGLLYPCSTYRFTTDLFNRAKYAMLSCAIVNLVLSLILGKNMGINGILIATAISRLITTFWYDARILYKEYFDIKFAQFFKFEIKNIIFTCVVFILTFNLTNLINGNRVVDLIVKMIIVVIVINILYFLRYRKTEEYAYTKGKIIDILKNKTK